MDKVIQNDRSLKIRLVEAAAAALAKPRTFKLPTMRELAASAGVAPGAAYRHFKSQDELFLAVILYLFTEMEHELQKAVGMKKSQKDKVEAMAQAYVKWGIANPGAYQLILETTDDEAVLKSGQRAGLHMIAQLAALLSPNGVPTSEMTNQATQLWTSLHGIVSLRNHKTGMPWVNTAQEQVTDLLKTLN